ncbi:putative transcription factor C2C2-CO-like family [Helianthus debilis subsp. tardiflorus]
MTNHRTKSVRMLQIVQEQLSSPLSAQLLELCESNLFQEAPQNSEVASSSNKSYEEQSSCTINPSILPYCSTGVDNNAIASTTTNDFSLMFEDKITPIDLTNTPHFTNNQYPFSNQDQFDLSLLQNQNQFNDPIFSYPCALSSDHDVPIVGPTKFLNICEQDIISSMPPSKFMLSDNMLSSNYPFINPSINSNLPMSTEEGNLFLGNDIQIHELEFHGDNNGIFCNDHLPHSFNSNDLQAFSNESQHLANGSGSSTIPLPSDITSLESESLRVTTTKLTSEERKEKINKYMKKRNERNFNKKIKYACRKTLADSRPRVRGRFAKHDEFGENNITNSNHEEDTDEDEQNVHEVVKEEENFESSDILAHISGVNSFKCNYPIQSWI